MTMHLTIHHEVVLNDKFEIILLYSTIVLYSRDDEGVGMARDKISPENLPLFPSL